MNYESTDARLRAAIAAVSPDAARPLHDLQVELALDDLENNDREYNGII